MRLLAIATLILFLFTPVVQAKPKERPRAPEIAQELASTPPQTSFTSWPVSAAEALSAAHRPDAVTEVAAGLTPEQATGADLGAQQEVEDDGGGPGESAYKLCRFGTLGAQWGTWPYNQSVYDNTYWCWNSGSLNITYRSTYVTTDGAFCSADNSYSFKYAGGIGYPYVYLEAGASFSCPTTLPWVTLHFRRCLHDVWYPYGARTDAYACFG